MRPGSGFQSTLSLRRATPAGNTLHSGSTFQSTPSLRRATGTGRGVCRQDGVSIHALLAESDIRLSDGRGNLNSFNPRPPCGERQETDILTSADLVFQSTPSLRRATVPGKYPQFPMIVSIHALLAESDFPPPLRRCIWHSFNPRPPCGERPRISLSFPSSTCFNPRPPCGERQLRPRMVCSLPCFNPRPPCGERLPDKPAIVLCEGFQSTPSLRRATITERMINPTPEFQSTPSLRRATRNSHHNPL